MPDSTCGQWKGVRQDEPVGSWSLELPHSSLLPVGPCCLRGQWLPGVTEKDQPSTVSWANACTWNRRPLGQIPAFPSEQGAVSLVAASHIYIMAAAHRKGSGLGSEPFMKAACSLLHHHTSIHMRALTVRSPACPSQGSWLLWPVQRCPQHTHDPYEKPSGIHCCNSPFLGRANHRQARGCNSGEGVWDSTVPKCSCRAVAQMVLDLAWRKPRELSVLLSFSAANHGAAITAKGRDAYRPPEHHFSFLSGRSFHV